MKEAEKNKVRLSFCLAGNPWEEEMTAALPRQHPALKYQLDVSDAPDEWSSGLPLAAGLIGASIWNDGGQIVFSLDRTDLWDKRPIPEFEIENYTFDRLLSLVESDRMEKVAEEFEAPYHRPGPTKLPAGRLLLQLAEPSKRRTLSLHSATAEIGGSVKAAVLATSRCVAIWSTRAGALDTLSIQPPAFGEPAPPKDGGLMDMISAGRPQDLDYDRAQPVAEESVSGFVQTIHDGAYAAGFLRFEEAGMDVALAYVALADTAQAAKTALIDHLHQTARSGFGAALSSHEQWWQSAWLKSWLSIPDAPDRERAWAIDTYFLIAAAQADAPPVALQGPWTFDGGYLPPWKGDYHHDLNTQMTYWPLYSAGRLEASRVMVDWLWETRETCRQWTRRFYGKPGLNVPMTADIDNRQLGGWAPYTHSLTSAAWLAHNSWLHWRHSGDRDLLERKIAPWIWEAAEFLDAIMAIDPKTGVRCPPVSTSPEWNDNRREAFFPTWTNYDLELTRFLFWAASDVARALGDPERAERWNRAVETCPPPILGEDRSLAITQGVLWDQPHRHFSNALAIMPLQTLDPLTAEDRAILEATLDRIQANGTGMWMGYTFGWIACHEARRGNAEACVRALEIFDDGFRYPNGFHTNGDVSGKGYMQLPFSCFTLEGNSAALAAIQDMFVQSRPGRIDLVRAIPENWRSAELHGFVADGAIEIERLTIADGQLKAVLRSPADVSVEVTVSGGSIGEITLTANQPTELTAPLA